MHTSSRVLPRVSPSSSSSLQLAQPKSPCYHHNVRHSANVLVARASRKSRQQDNVLVQGLVSAMTESLRVLGVGKDRYQELANAQAQKQLLKQGDIPGVIQRIKADFTQGYIITGIIDDNIYADDCYFADPTVSFSGLQLWKRNLQLLVPFLIEPSVRLRSIERTGINEDGSETLKSEWELRTYLSLPWRPFIDILGTTSYTLNADANLVVEHIESWNVSGLQALGQMLRPTDRATWPWSSNDRNSSSSSQ